MKNYQSKPDRPAPDLSLGWLAWLKQNLFSNIPNTLTSVLIILLLINVLPGMLDWLIFSADWLGSSQDACTKEGACWVFVSAWLQQFIYGSYPDDSLWRVNLSLMALLSIIILSLFVSKNWRNTVFIPVFLIFPFLCAAFLDGRLFGLTYISTDHWGGFSLNIFLAAASIIVAFPISIMWALGRRSSMPFVKSVSVILIEFFRGVPVLALFFMGAVMLPLFFPEGTTVDKLIRVWIVLVLFMAGYMAEVFRGGFQAIPSGQYEAADSLGLSYWQKTRFIILPQVIQVSMPNILATFIMLFKNTTFLLIIGIFELLSTTQTALNNSSWLGGHAQEGYIFVGIVFWCCCFGMSLISARIERKLNTQHSN